MKVFIEEDYAKDTVKVFAVQPNGSKEDYLHYNGEQIDFIENDYRTGSLNRNIKPLFEVSSFVFRSLLPALIEKGSQQGIRTENENHLQGKLKATEMHLDDMREISKHLLKMNK